ncbi:MAG: hypothetical protein AB7Q81_17830 [Gammaproteobacteria bacterium]
MRTTFTPAKPRHGRVLPAWLAALPLGACAFDAVETKGWTFTPGLELRFGLQYGEGINFGLGALDDGDDDRTSASLSLEPALTIEHAALDGTAHATVSVVAASNALDGEVSGQFANAGDSRIDIDRAHVGWRNERFEIALGPQVFSVGDGLVLADGNFDVGASEGQFWVGPFDAWKNAAVLKWNGEKLRGDVFWLRSGGGFGDARLYGANVENVAAPWGRWGAMVLDLYQGDALAYDGVLATNLRALDVPVPGIAGLKLYGEVVVQRGRDDDHGGVANRGLGWYLEAGYTLPALPWTTILTYRYSHFSGDDPATAANESYRSMFYGFYLREWDTFYQGEIAGEYHLFNTNQVTQFVKLRTFASARVAFTLYYFQHDLEERNYYGAALASRDWADEINAGVEYFLDQRAYVYAGIAWSSPNAAAREAFGGSQDFTVVQTWMSFHF